MWCVLQNTIPATRNLVHPLPAVLDSEASGIVYVRGASVVQPRQLHAAVSNSFGFGGTNCSLLFTRV